MLDQDLFTRLSATKSVARSFQVLFHRYVIFILIGLVEILPLFLFSFVLGFSMIPDASGTISPNSGEILALVLLAPIMFLVIMVGAGATIRATAEIYAGEDPKLVPCLREGVRRLCSLFCFGLLIYAILIGSTLVFGVVVGLLSLLGGDTWHMILFALSLPIYCFAYFYVLIAFQITPPAIIVERKSAKESMRRSWELVEGNRCYIIGTVLLMILLNLAVQLVSMIFGPLGPILFMVWSAVAMPIGSILGTVLFFSLRVEREGLNKNILYNEIFGMDNSGRTQLMAGDGVADDTKGPYKRVSNPTEETQNVV